GRLLGIAVSFERAVLSAVVDRYSVAPGPVPTSLYLHHFGDGASRQLARFVGSSAQSSDCLAQAAYSGAPSTWCCAYRAAELHAGVHGRKAASPVRRRNDAVWWTIRIPTRPTGRALGRLPPSRRARRRVRGKDAGLPSARSQ